MKRRSLEQLARTSGVAEQSIELADDSDNPKQGLIRLILDAEEAQSGDVQKWRMAQREVDLKGMKRKQLESLARLNGVPEQSIDAADDSDNPKEAFTRLILDAEKDTLQNGPAPKRRRLADSIVQRNFGLPEAEALRLFSGSLLSEQFPADHKPKQLVEPSSILWTSTKQASSNIDADNASL
jgi:hypothetical protein